MKRILVYGLALILPILTIVYFHSYYDNQSPFSIPCIFHQTTGLWCPGCGGQRAMALLLHGNFLASLRHNLLLPFALVVILHVYYIIIEAWILGNKKALNGFHIPPKAAQYFFGFVIVYFIIRNIPASPFVFLAPPAG